MIGRRSLAGAAVLAFASPVFADRTARAQDLREELMALERQNWEAMKERDRPAMRRLLADDLLQIFSDGSWYYKSEFLDYMVDYRLDSYEIEPTYAVRRIGPDVAALVYRVTSRGAARFTRTTTEKVLATSLYARRNGTWTSVLYQETPSK